MTADRSSGSNAPSRPGRVSGAKHEQNRILAALPPDDYERLLPSLKLRPLDFKQVLYRQGEPISHVWFPNGGVCSIVRRLEDGGCAEVGTVGTEGLVGGGVVFGEEEAFGDAIIQVPDGDAYTMAIGTFRDEMGRGGRFCDLVTRFTQALTVMIMQTAACNSLHVVEDRLARWLLMCHDRVGTDVFTITQDFLAMMLSVRRASVTDAVTTLQNREVISYARREMTIVSRPDLEALSCECYRVVQAQFRRLLP